jgi:hypothetical protein
LLHELSEALVDARGNADAKLNSVHRETRKIPTNLADDRRYLTRATIAIHVLELTRVPKTRFSRTPTVLSLPVILHKRPVVV